MELREEELRKVEEIKEKLAYLDTRNVDEKIQDIKDSIGSVQRTIKRGIRNIAQHYERERELMIEMETIKKSIEKKDFTDDIKALLNHPKVEDVNASEDKIVTIRTSNIDIYDEDGNRYLGNEYDIYLDFKTMSVRINGLDEDLCRKSCWTGHDPHPHVNGYDGNPCLGNAGSMLCQTMNELEIYASFIVVYNFLQQVNTSDIAGEYIENWDCVDEEGNIIDNPHQRQVYTCDECGYTTTNEDEIYTCDECDSQVCYDHRIYIENFGYVCTSCIANNWEVCDICDEYDRKEDMIEKDGERYCTSCAERYLEECPECGKMVEKPKMENIYDGERRLRMCRDCIEENTEECNECCETIHINRIKEYKGDYYCESCYKEIKEEEERLLMEEATNEC